MTNKEYIYCYMTTDDEMKRLLLEFKKFLTKDLGIVVDDTKIKLGKYNSAKLDIPAKCLYYDNNSKKYISNKPHIKHFKNNHCNIFECYLNSERFIKFIDLKDPIIIRSIISDETLKNNTITQSNTKSEIENIMGIE